MAEPSCPLSDDPLWIVAPAQWRDACFSLPASRALAEKRAVHVLCPDFQRELWEAAGLREVRSFESSTKPRVLAKELDGIAQCLLWEDNIGAQAMIHAGVPARHGLPAKGLAKSLTHPITLTRRPGPPEHQVRRFLDSAAHLGAGPFEPSHFSPLPGTSDQHTGVWLLSPDSDFGDHFQWPAERWPELIERLPLDRERIHIHDSGPIARRIAEATSLQLVEPRSPTETAAYTYCLAADSSFPHMAAAFGVTCAVLFGPGDPDRTRPLGKQHLSIRRKAECSPCLLDRCALDLRCQLELEVDQVHDELTAFMGT